jgi:hypothetical protein
LESRPCLPMREQAAIRPRGRAVVLAISQDASPDSDANVSTGLTALRRIEAQQRPTDPRQPGRLRGGHGPFRTTTPSKQVMAKLRELGTYFRRNDSDNETEKDRIRASNDVGLLLCPRPASAGGASRRRRNSHLMQYLAFRVGKYAIRRKRWRDATKSGKLGSTVTGLGNDGYKGRD